MEYKPVSGPFENSGVYVTRVRWQIQADAGRLFDFLTGPAGYRVIDPACDPADHRRPPLESYPGACGCVREAACAGISLPFLPKSEFVVLNITDKGNLTFVSKSIIHPSRPGASVYSRLGRTVQSPARSLNTFGYTITPWADGSCRFASANYMELCAGTPAKLNNFINMKIFYPMLRRRIDRTVKKNGL